MLWMNRGNWKIIAHLPFPKYFENIFDMFTGIESKEKQITVIANDNSDI